MMNEKIDAEKNIDDFMLPGFRFHPTDEELVGFYLKRKIQQRSLPIELIKQVDIYKYDPWDLPKLASTGEKEWYFYCPRDRKYRNSTRPNRVTGSGFWKATGTDRPIYSSDGTKCIGLKKSLVFYRGRAAKGFKTDWMMHEFRLPSVTDVGASPPQKMSDKNLPATDSWAICRIFKKTSSMANRLLKHANSHQYSWNNVSLSDHQATKSSPDHAAFTYSPHHRSTISSDNLSALNNIPSSYKIFTTTTTTTGSNADHLAFSPNSAQVPATKNSTTTATDHFTSLLFNNQSPVCLDFEGSQHYFNGLSSSSSLTQLMMQENVSAAENEQEGLRKSTSATNIRTNPFSNKSSMGFPFSLQPSSSDSWKPPPNPIINLPWDNFCPTEMSSNTAYSTTNKSCYTS